MSFWGHYVSGAFYLGGVMTSYDLYFVVFYTKYVAVSLSGCYLVFSPQQRLEQWPVALARDVTSAFYAN